MALSKEIYQELEDVVGPRNASNDPAILATYQFPLNVTSIHLGPFNSYTPRGGAVVLPGTVEEVQKIVKICNKYKLKYKASSTFWGAMGYPSHEDAVQLDMRRMDRVLEIDEKNMYAVVEPYVIGVNLQADAMKVGLKHAYYRSRRQLFAVGQCHFLYRSRTGYYFYGKRRRELAGPGVGDSDRRNRAHGFIGSGFGLVSAEKDQVLASALLSEARWLPAEQWASIPNAPSNYIPGRDRRLCRLPAQSRLIGLRRKRTSGLIPWLSRHGRPGPTARTRSGMRAWAILHTGSSTCSDATSSSP